MLSKKSQTASRLISRRKTNHAMIVRRYAPRLVTKVTGEFIALRCLPPHIYKIAAPTARRICVQRCKKTFSTASVKASSMGSPKSSGPPLLTEILRVRRLSQSANKGLHNTFQATGRRQLSSSDVVPRCTQDTSRQRRYLDGPQAAALNFSNAELFRRFRSRSPDAAC